MKRLCLTAVLAATTGVFAWDYEKVDVVDTNELETLCAEWKVPAPAKARKVLLFSECYGYNHKGGRCYGDWTFKRVGELSGAWSIVKVSDPKKLADRAFLSGFDAICFCNSSGLVEAKAPGMTDALIDFVKKDGKGIALIHSALDAFGDSDRLLDLFGGYFRGHPWHSEGTWRFLNEQPTDPINASFRDERVSFSRADEIYQFPAFYNRQKCKVLISVDLTDPVTKAAETWWGKFFGLGSTRADHDYAVSWTREVGKGRIFYTSFGHDRGAFLDRTRLHHMFAGLRYAIGDGETKKSAETSADKAFQRTDWANGPWKEKLDARVKAAKGKNLDIVVFGDSITFGWIISADKSKSGGLEVWRRHFGDLETMTLGMSGDRTEHLLWRVTDGAQADGWKARNIFVMIGINNALQKKGAPADTARGMKAVVDALAAKHPDSRIIMLGCTPVVWRKDAWVRDYNAIISKFADGRRIFYHDMAGAFKKASGETDASLFSDGLHPNAAGYEKMAQEMKKALSAIK